VEAIVAETEQGGGILGVVDGSSPKGVETEEDVKKRHGFLRRIGYKRKLSEPAPVRKPD